MRKLTEPNKERTNCTKGTCPYIRPECRGCGFDRRELKRRRALPLALDAKTGLWRKYVGTKKETDSHVGGGAASSE